MIHLLRCRKQGIGDDCSVNPYCVLYGHGGLTIGNGVRIAAHCVIVPSNHIIDQPQTPIYKLNTTAEGIHIEDFVWIGCGVRILDGVPIGRNSVIAAGAVVSKSIPPDSILGGVPAIPVSRRLAAEVSYQSKPVEGFAVSNSPDVAPPLEKPSALTEKSKV